MIVTINFLIGALSVFFMMLVLRGQYRHFATLVAIMAQAACSAISERVFRRYTSGTTLAIHRFERLTAGDWMRFAVAVFHIKGVVRIITYDVVWLLLANPRAAWVAYWNISFCAMATLGSLAALWAMYLNIPDEERGDYSWLTAPWYPSQSPLNFRRKNR